METEQRGNPHVECARCAGAAPLTPAAPSTQLGKKAILTMDAPAPPRSRWRPQHRAWGLSKEAILTIDAPAPLRREWRPQHRAWSLSKEVILTSDALLPCSLLRLWHRARSLSKKAICTVEVTETLLSRSWRRPQHRARSLNNVQSSLWRCCAHRARRRRRALKLVDLEVGL
mmetsp:Transcript_43354/g.130014  ORF Transcript_43354/g.130014 Transcript_43354/m.130014 type:complete len:172 (+) Transcript_43354:229-744(+)